MGILWYSKNEQGFTTTICPYNLHAANETVYIDGSYCRNNCEFHKNRNSNLLFVDCSYEKIDDKKEKNMYDIKEVTAFEIDGKIYNSMEEVKEVLIDRTISNLLLNYKNNNKDEDYFEDYEIIDFIKENIDNINSKMSDIVSL